MLKLHTASSSRSKHLTASRSTTRHNNAPQLPCAPHPYTHTPGQQAGYAPSQYPQQPRLAYEQQLMPQSQQMMGQLTEQFAQTQQQNWDM